MFFRCPGRQQSRMPPAGLRARPLPALGSGWDRRPARRSLGRSPAVGADRRVRARPEPGHARARELARGGFEVPALDPLDRIHDHGPAALEVFRGQGLLAVLLQAGRAADAEDVLAHAAPDPVLRIPEGEEPRLEAKRFAFVVEAVFARQVVERQLHIVKLRAEVHLIGEAHRLAGARLVVDDLHLTIAHVVDAVDLADDLDPVELEMKPLLDRERAEASYELHARDRPDVVAQHGANLLLLALAVEDALHSR